MMILICSYGMAQFNTVTIDGRITSNEYGSHIDGENQGASGSILWYMTWNNDSLYVAIAGSDSAEGAIIYIDIDADQPVNINLASAGTIDGKEYDNVTYNPPFRADFVCYIKDAYQEFRRADGAGSWTSNRLNGFNVKTKPHAATADTIEIAIPWDSITNGQGRPDQFNWFGHKTSNGSTNSYGQIPSENPSGSGATQSATRYFTVSTTGNGSSTYPFARNSYTTPQNSSGTLNFGDIDVYDFTINDYGDITIQKNTNSVFKIEHDLVITYGELDLGNSGLAYSDTIKNDIIVASNGDLTFSSSTSNVYLGGDFVNNGTFTNNGSILFLDGTVKKQTLSGDFKGSNRFSQLEIDNSFGAIFSGTDSLVIDDTLRLKNGVFEVGSGKRIRMRNAAAFIPDGGKSNSFIDGTLEWEMEGTDNKVFPVGDIDERARLEIEPQNTKVGRSYVIKYSKTGYGSYTTHSNSPTLDHVSLLEFWEVGVEGPSLVSADSSAKIGGHWRTYSDVFNLAATRDSLRICHYDGNDWEIVSGTQSISGVVDSGTVVTDYTSDFSPFTLGTLSGRNLLPVQFLVLSLQNNQLNWSTASEVNNSHFNIYIKDKETETLIGRVEGKGNTNELSEYRFDVGEGRGLCFLLVQVDFDGKESRLGLVCAREASDKRLIFSNPVYGQRLVPLQETKQKEIEIYNRFGEMIYKGDYNTFDLDRLISGLYFIKSKKIKGFITQRIIKI